MPYTQLAVFIAKWCTRTRLAVCYTLALFAHMAGRPLDGANNAAKILQLKQRTPAEKSKLRR